MSVANPTKTEEIEARIELLEALIVTMPPTTLAAAATIELLKREIRSRTRRRAVPP